MKKILISLLLIAISIAAYSQGYLGMRDTRYVYGGYTFKFGLDLSLEHSLYSEHFGYQKGRLYVGYGHAWKYGSIGAKAYGSTVWNASYQDAGMLIRGEVYPFSIWTIDATLNPHYDTGLGYQTCFSAGTSVRFYKDISLLLHYSTIPEYRESEKRIRGGLQFKVLNLTVQPEISFPAAKRINNVRVLCSLKYEFYSIKKK